MSETKCEYKIVRRGLIIAVPLGVFIILFLQWSWTFNFIFKKGVSDLMSMYQLIIDLVFLIGLFCLIFYSLYLFHCSYKYNLKLKYKLKKEEAVNLRNQQMHEEMLSRLKKEEKRERYDDFFKMIEVSKTDTKKEIKENLKKEKLIKESPDLKKRADVFDNIVHGVDIEIFKNLIENYNKIDNPKTETKS